MAPLSRSLCGFAGDEKTFFAAFPRDNAPGTIEWPDLHGYCPARITRESKGLSMASLESNKIAAAVLTAGVIAMSAGFAAELLYHPEMLEENVYVVATADDGDAAEATEVAAAPALEPIGPLLAAADAANGETVARKCVACHSFDEGGPTKVGPNLYNVVNRGITNYDGFAFSEALLAKADQVWDYENLNGFLNRPREWAPGTKMSYAGLRKTSDRADLIAYLRNLSGDPAPLPE